MVLDYDAAHEKIHAISWSLFHDPDTRLRGHAALSESLCATKYLLGRTFGFLRATCGSKGPHRGASTNVSPPNDEGCSLCQQKHTWPPELSRETTLYQGLVFLYVYR